MELDLKIKPRKLTHRELCEIGAKWLKKSNEWYLRSNYVAVELVTSCRESPDIFGFDAYSSTLIEVKVSRSDFKADFKKPHRNGELEGLCETRYYLCPKDLIKPNDLPEKWGLLYYEKGKIEIIKKSEVFKNRNYRGEFGILYSIIRRTVKSKIFDFRNIK